MARITCTRSIGFDAGHRVMGHEGKCQLVHGHRYTIEATFSVAELDDVGRVVDFGVIKTKLGAWIDQHWDHTMILWDKDKNLGEAIAKETGQTVYYLPSNPTAENLAAYLLEQVCPKLFAGEAVVCEQVRIHETPNCFATATLDV